MLDFSWWPSWPNLGRKCCMQFSEWRLTREYFLRNSWLYNSRFPQNLSIFGANLTGVTCWKNTETKVKWHFEIASYMIMSQIIRESAGVQCPLDFEPDPLWPNYCMWIQKVLLLKNTRMIILILYRWKSHDFPYCSLSADTEQPAEILWKIQISTLKWKCIHSCLKRLL